MQITRRDFLRVGLVVPPLVILGCSDDDEPSASASPTAESTARAEAAAGSTATAASGASAQLAPTPDCGDADDITPAQTEGPYFTPNSPERQSLRESGLQGTTLLLEGYVLSTNCQPVSRALVDFWQCDAAGNYDNTGYRLRGHQFTDSSGRYRLESIVPGLYPGRTQHIHVRVQPPNGRVLTTQLYFPAVAQNRSDGIYRAECEITAYRDAGGGKAGSFDFVLQV
jgi:protocatechuate 3,4-dioxygenase beta subunit